MDGGEDFSDDHSPDDRSPESRAGDIEDSGLDVVEEQEDLGIAVLFYQEEEGVVEVILEESDESIESYDPGVVVQLEQWFMKIMQRQMSFDQLQHDCLPVVAALLTDIADSLHENFRHFAKHGGSLLFAAATRSPHLCLLMPCLALLHQVLVLIWTRDSTTVVNWHDNSRDDSRSNHSSHCTLRLSTLRRPVIEQLIMAPLTTLFQSFQRVLCDEAWSETLSETLSSQSETRSYHSEPLSGQAKQAKSFRHIFADRQKQVTQGPSFYVVASDLIQSIQTPRTPFTSHHIIAAWLCWPQSLAPEMVLVPILDALVLMVQSAQLLLRDPELCKRWLDLGLESAVLDLVVHSWPTRFQVLQPVKRTVRPESPSQAERPEPRDFVGEDEASLSTSVNESINTSTTTTLRFSFKGPLGLHLILLLQQTLYFRLEFHEQLNTAQILAYVDVLLSVLQQEAASEEELKSIHSSTSSKSSHGLPSPLIVHRVLQALDYLFGREQDDQALDHILTHLHTNYESYDLLDVLNHANSTYWLDLLVAWCSPYVQTSTHTDVLEPLLSILGHVIANPKAGPERHYLIKQTRLFDYLAELLMLEIEDGSPKKSSKKKLKKKSRHKKLHRSAYAMDIAAFLSQTVKQADMTILWTDQTKSKTWFELFDIVLHEHLRKYVQVKCIQVRLDLLEAFLPVAAVQDLLAVAIDGQANDRQAMQTVRPIRSV